MPKILLKKSGTPSAVPSSLDHGELAINYADGTLYYKNSSNVITAITGSGSGITDIVQDTTPQLGGNLDVNGQSIVSASNGDIAITPNGTGAVIIDGNEFPQTQGIKGQVLVADGGGLLEWKYQEQLTAAVINADSVTINKGEPVYVFSAQGDQISVKRAINTSDATSAQTLGLAAESIAATASGTVICQGVLFNVDTSAYTAGDALYLGSTAGSVTTTKPYAPNHLVYLGFVEKVNANSGRIYVRVQNGYELQELHNVQITSTPSDGQALAYETSSSLWKPTTINSFSTIAVAGQSNVVADSVADTLTLAAGSNITITTNAGTDTVTIAATSGGTVTDVSIVSANGFAGSVATSTSTPAITLTTSVTGVLKGNGTAISAATAGTDYLAPPSGTAILKANSGGALANATAGTDYQAPITLTTTGSSGAATLVNNTLNIPQYAGGASVAGSNTHVQFNDSGSFGGTADLTFDKTTKKLTVGGTISGGPFVETNLTVSSNYTISSGKSAMSVGPITVNNGVTITVPSGAKWVVL